MHTIRPYTGNETEVHQCFRVEEQLPAQSRDVTLHRMDTHSAALVIKKGREKPIRNRHPWIFSGAVARVEGQPEPGDIVEVVDGSGAFLARAYYNPHSQINGRILT